MTAGIPSIAPAIPASKALKSAEWMAENAYIAPGFHRLLTAGGLTMGLYAGRKFMDVVTGRNATTGEETPAAQTNELMRPLHGVMRYNPYSDHAADRWKFVVDKMTPVAVGAVGAYFGGKYFFNGKLPNKEILFPAGAATTIAVAAKKFSSEITDSAMRLSNSDSIRKWAAGTFIEGSSTGQHIFGALWPFNNGMIAVSFQEGAQRSIGLPSIIPGARKVNQFLGNHGGTSRGMFSAMRDTAKWMETNIMSGMPVEQWATTEALHTRALDGLQKFPTQSKAFVGKLADTYKDLIHQATKQLGDFKAANPTAKDGEIRQHVYDFITGKTNAKNGLLGSAHDHMLHSIGIDLKQTNIGQGPFQEFGRFFGSRKNQVGVLEGHAEYLNKEFNAGLDPKTWAANQLHTPPWKTMAGYGGGAVAIAGGLTAAGMVGAKMHSRSARAHQPHILDQSTLAQHIKSTEDKPKSDHNIVDWINDKPLNVAHWVSRVVIAPPSMHRFMNAAYLSGVLYIGMKGADILTGHKLTKLNSGTFRDVEKLVDGIKTIEKVPTARLLKEEVWKPLQGLHDKLNYTPGSAAVQDRWRQAAHYIMPVGLGMFGTWTGSRMYFNDRIKSLQHVSTLEDYADKISMEQSNFYAGATAVTSIFNTGSGLHLLPVFNYSANLHNRYLLGSGQQVAMPGIGKWWSGNAGTTPWGVKRTLGQLSSYLTYNDSARPKELRSLVHSLIGKLYPDLSDAELLDHKQVMIDRIHDVRDSYLVEGVVPTSKQAALGEAMNKLFSGNGFEALLRESGLDPAKANLASNGASGAIANFFGKKHAVDKLSEEYRHTFSERLTATDHTKPSDFLKSLLDKGPVQTGKITENTPKTYIERTKGDSSSLPAMSMSV